MIRGDAVHIFGHLASFTLKPAEGVIAFACRCCGACSQPVVAGVPAHPTLMPVHERWCLAARCLPGLMVARSVEEAA